MATKFTYKNEVGRKWDVGSGTRPTQTKLKKKKKKNILSKGLEASQLLRLAFFDKNIKYFQQEFLLHFWTNNY
jgi:hypothetical protein